MEREEGREQKGIEKEKWRKYNEESEKKRKKR